MKKQPKLKRGYLPNCLQPDITLIANGLHTLEAAIILEKEKTKYKRSLNYI
jgi:hypothetical protein